MPNIINAQTSPFAALTQSNDGTAVLQLQTGSTAALTIDASQNVGIGTATPYRQFQVGNYSTNATMALGSISSGYSTICFATADSAPGRYIGLIEYGHSANYMGFTTNGTERLRIDSSGNLGLGGTPSAWATLTPVLQMGTGGTFLSARTTQSVLYLGTNAYYNGTNWIYTTSNPASYYAQNSGQHQWNTAATGTAGATVSFTQAMTLDASGNLNVTSPAFTDSIVTINATSTNVSQRLNFTANGTIQTQIYDDSTVTRLNAVTSKPLVFSTANTERMRIDTSGNLLLGATTNANSARIKIEGGTRTIKFFDLTATGGENWILDSTNTSGSTDVFGIYALGASGLYIQDTGNVGIGTSSPATKLEVAVGSSGGTLQISNSANTNTPKLRVTNSQSSIDIAQDGTGGYIEQVGAYPIRFYTNNTERARISSAGGFSVGTTTDPGAGLISDQYGNVRSLPLNSQTSAYIVAASDNGKVISITTGGVTINNSIMSAGMVVTIYNNSASSQTITQGTGVTLQWAGQSSSTTGNRTLGLYGMATVYFLSASSAVITGSGLT